MNIFVVLQILPIIKNENNENKVGLPLPHFLC